MSLVILNVGWFGVCLRIIETVDLGLFFLWQEIRLVDQRHLRRIARKTILYNLLNLNVDKLQQDNKKTTLCSTSLS